MCASVYVLQIDIRPRLNHLQYRLCPVSQPWTDRYRCPRQTLYNCKSQNRALLNLRINAVERILCRVSIHATVARVPQLSQVPNMRRSMPDPKFVVEKFVRRETCWAIPSAGHNGYNSKTQMGIQRYSVVFELRSPAHTVASLV